MLDASNQRTYGLVTSFLTEIILALKEVLRTSGYSVSFVT